MDAYYKLIYISLMYLKPFDYCNCQNVTFLFSFKDGGRHLMLYVDDYGSMLNYMNAKQPCRVGGGEFPTTCIQRFSSSVFVLSQNGHQIVRTYFSVSILSVIVLL